MKQRAIGLDLARAYAILGMYIVNFTFCFGSFRNDPILGWFSSLFVGNSTSIFIICAGMSIVLFTKKNEVDNTDRAEIRSVIVKRSLFLFTAGLLLYNWWPGDILHFYGGYMHLSVFILSLPRRYYLWIAFLAVVIYNLLQLFIPITTGWDMQTTQYADFWTARGFIRNTFYNGWNSIFPWFAYYAIGMYLGQLDWSDKKIRKKIFIAGICLLAIFKGLRMFISYDWNSPRNWLYSKYRMQLMEDYFPANIPYLMITIGFALVVISICTFIGNAFAKSNFIKVLAHTGQMTLSLYILHMTIGVILLSAITHKPYTGYLPQDTPVAQSFILIYALSFFSISVVFSYFWMKQFKRGPIELIYHKLSGTVKKQ